MSTAEMSVEFECPNCQRRACLNGTPSRLVEIAKSLGWVALEPSDVEPLPLLACSNECWAAYWLRSDNLQMRYAMKQLATRNMGRDPLTGLFGPRPEVRN